VVVVNGAGVWPGARNPATLQAQPLQRLWGKKQAKEQGVEVEGWGSGEGYIEHAAGIVQLM
jgi:hypothetical protein